MNYKNKYLHDIEKGLKLISSLEETAGGNNLLDEKLKELNKLSREAYIKLNFQQDLLSLYNELEEIVNFPVLANKRVVAVAGRKNVAKSGFINSVLDINNLATDIKTTTAIPTYICASDQEKITTYNTYKSCTEIEQEALDAIRSDFEYKYGINLSQVLKKIIVQVKSLRYANLAFLDTPSYKNDGRSIDLNSTEIKKADYLIWLLDIEQEHLLAEDIELINQLDFSGDVFILFNKAEDKDIVELKEALNMAENKLYDLKNPLIAVSAYSSVRAEELLTNKLADFLTEINQQENEVTLTNQFRELFSKLKEQHFKKLNCAKNKLLSLEKIIDENRLNREEKYIKRLLKNVKQEIKIEKEHIKELKTLRKQIMDLVKDILIEVEISFFDYQERGYKLLEAIKNDNFKLAERLIDLGGNLEVEDKQGQTPLALAVKKDAKELQEKLLIAGVKLTYQGKEIIADLIPGEGSKKQPYIIFALSALEKIGSEEYPLDAHYKLGRDIDASKTQQREYNNGQGWQPIGKSKKLNDYQAFTGSFDGAGYVIKNLYFRRSTESQVGLFRVVGQGGVVKNLDLSAADFLAKIEVGGIAGRVRLGEILNCSFNGKVKGNKKVGQIVGKNEGGEIKSVSSLGEVVGDIDVGGLIGYNLYYGLLKNSYSLSKVRGDKKVGGAIGCNEQGGEVDSSYAKGDVIGGAIAGGLVGYNYGDIKNSFASGDVTGSYQLGGLIGKSESKLGFGRAEVIDSYALGNVRGKKIIGGLVGVNKELIRKSYASGKIEGDEILGGLVGYNSGLIEESYVSRKIISSDEKNNLIGKSVEGKVIDSYWEKEYMD